MYAFEERQRFNQWWIWLIVASQPLFVFLSASTDSFSLASLWPLGFTLFIVVSLRLFKLETRINAYGISVRLFPIHLKFKTFTWDELESISVRSYNPLREFGGWGYRSWGGKKGNAWNISGNQGLQLKFKSGKELLIGTQQPEAMVQCFEKLIQESPNSSIPFKNFK
jgi:hypothetical protein